MFLGIETLSSVGPSLAIRLKKSGKERIIDVLISLPRSIETRVYREDILTAPDGELISCTVLIQRHIHPQSTRHPYKVLCSQNEIPVFLTFFRGRRPYLEKALPQGSLRLISGILRKTNAGLEIIHPDFIGPVEAQNLCSGPLPLYETRAGISQFLYRKIVKESLSKLPHHAPEWLPCQLRSAQSWSDWKGSLIAVHNPRTQQDVLPTSPYRERLAFDELFAYQLTLHLSRHFLQNKTARPYHGTGFLLQKILTFLPFSLTTNQRDVLKTLSEDLKKTSPMLRLLQGDVGSGKTIVAFLAMLQVIESQGQCALLAPTEILAKQHYETALSLFKNYPIHIEIFLGKTKKKEKDTKRTDLERGHIHIAIGTHALLEDEINFSSLGLIVIDEQHRFGVDQRRVLIEKGQGAHVLVMSATPIPRSLAMTLYGDLDVSLLREKPAERPPVHTYVLSLKRIHEVYAALKRALAQKEKAYWVCPLVEESEHLDLGHVEERTKELQNFLGLDCVAWIHGRMSIQEKTQALHNFKTGSCQILVATTVIEVGLHIPDATIMIIEHAERFGLAQLHQLRGRIGRGKGDSTCLLLYGEALSDVGQKRLELMKSTHDGFILAEEDMRLRGAGDLLGTRQSGMPEFKIACLETQGYLLEAARNLARETSHQTLIEGHPVSFLLSLFNGSTRPSIKIDF